MSAFLFCLSAALADTITLKNGKDLKGLVVEQHADRIILSTADGEVPLLLKGIKNIQYDSPEQNFMKIAKRYESEGKLGEALAYYEKVLEVNPDFEEAKTAAIGVRNRFWAQATEGPRNEVEKQQAIYDAWGQGKTIEGIIEQKEKEQIRAIRDGIGVTLEKKGDWARIESVDSKSQAALTGLKKNDRLVSMDGQSLRYLTLDVVRKKMMLPRYSNFQLEFERDCFLHKDTGKLKLKDLGLKFKLEYQGLKVSMVTKRSMAEQAGIRTGDFLIDVQGQATRYMPTRDVVRLIETIEEDRIVFTVRRLALLTRR